MVATSQPSPRSRATRRPPNSPVPKRATEAQRHQEIWGIRLPVVVVFVVVIEATTMDDNENDNEHTSRECNKVEPFSHSNTGKARPARCRSRPGGCVPCRFLAQAPAGWLAHQTSPGCENHGVSPKQAGGRERTQWRCIGDRIQGFRPQPHKLRTPRQ